MSTPKTITRGVGMMDGGPASCSRHNFVTEDSKEWYEHISGASHTHSGSADCIECGRRVNYGHIKKKGADSPPICDDCVKNRGLKA